MTNKFIDERILGWIEMDIFMDQNFTFDRI